MLGSDSITLTPCSTASIESPPVARISQATLLDSKPWSQVEITKGSEMKVSKSLILPDLGIA